MAWYNFIKLNICDELINYGNEKNIMLLKKVKPIQVKQFIK